MTQTPFSIRRATAKDTTTLAHFNIAMARETEDHALDTETVQAGVAHLFDAPEHGFYLVVESEDSVVGSLMITHEWSDWRDGLWWWIQSVYVVPNFRRQGVFSALYREVTTLARQDNRICGLRLYVEKDNTNAQQVYAHLGMSEAPYRVYEQLF